VGKAHQGRRAAPALLVAATLVALLISPAFARALDDGQPGPGERWAPGQILVRFHDHVGAAERERIARAAGAKLVSHWFVTCGSW